ncbi:hypothetical protein [Halococcus thailandensis]|uniref:hypothetical protein n=1 Tax=Halococcus thailandensis TaxID=335952 RepID=UPI001267DB3A|nr:hypothetical protein [Halococcus thailandensis]
MQSMLQISLLLGGVETLIIMAIMAVIGFFVGRWGYRDAKSRSSNWAWQWGVGVGILLIPIGPGLILLAIYFLARGDKSQPDSQTT